MEVVSLGDPHTHLDHLLRGELRDPPATTADHMIMRALTKGVLVVSLLDFETNLFEDPAVNEQRKRAIHSGFAHIVPAIPKKVKNLLSLEVPIQLQYRVENPMARGGVLDPVAS